MIHILKNILKTSLCILGIKNFVQQKYGIYSLNKKFKNKFYDFRKLYNYSDKRLSVEKQDIQPCLWDNSEKTDFDRHYVYHVAWAMIIKKDYLSIKYF